VARPDAWRLNAYNRLSFWIQCPPEAAALHRNGQEHGDQAHPTREAEYNFQGYNGMVYTTTDLPLAARPK
jgi:hypothetical protein